MDLPTNHQLPVSPRLQFQMEAADVQRAATGVVRGVQRLLTELRTEQAWIPGTHDETAAGLVAEF